MENVVQALGQWDLDMAGVRERMYRAATPRERERWHALWLLAQGWTVAAVATALDRDPHTVAGWVTALREQGPAGLAFTQTGGSPPC
jgi:transposase